MSKNKIKKIFLYFGIDLGSILALRHLPRYVKDCIKYTKSGGVINHFYPMIKDWGQPAGAASGHYFHQDLLVASYIFENSPTNHIDVGSRIDGFVAHVASFRKITVIDVREIKSETHQNIKYMCIDFSDKRKIDKVGEVDSISCLHALEHFGLGRYGDSLDPTGHVKGFENLINLLTVGGHLYISIPVAWESSTYFNAHRVFSPTDIFEWTPLINKLSLCRFDYISDSGDVIKNTNFKCVTEGEKYGCGIYTFIKTS